MAYKSYEDTGNYEEIIIYNKYQEITEKVSRNKAPVEYIDIYHNTVRVEQRNKNDKLNSDVAKKKVESKTLGIYYTINKTSKLYNTMITKIFSTQDFYRIDIAIKMIKNNDKLRRTTKAKLIRLLRLINRYGYSKAKEIWSTDKDRSTFYNNINAIKKLGINPITFDKVINGKKIIRESISNFSTLQNGVSDPFEKFRAEFARFNNDVSNSKINEIEQLDDETMTKNTPLFLLPKDSKTNETEQLDDETMTKNTPLFLIPKDL